MTEGRRGVNQHGAAIDVPSAVACYLARMDAVIRWGVNRVSERAVSIG
jgi:hypothetical protein